MIPRLLLPLLLLLVSSPAFADRGSFSLAFGQNTVHPDESFHEGVGLDDSSGVRLGVRIGFPLGGHWWLEPGFGFVDLRVSSYDTVSHAPYPLLSLDVRRVWPGDRLHPFASAGLSRIPGDADCYAAHAGGGLGVRLVWHLFLRLDARLRLPFGAVGLERDVSAGLELLF